MVATAALALAVLGCGGGDSALPDAAEQWCACADVMEEDCESMLVDVVRSECPSPEATAEAVLFCLATNGTSCPERAQLECRWIYADSAGNNVCRR